MSVKFVRLSSNRKIGVAAATYASQASCPKSCPFYNNGCYAESGPVGIHTAAVNKSSDSALEVAHKEAAAIMAAATDPRQPSVPLRLHVVGDCATPEAAAIVAAAAERYIANKGPVWTYTHAWREVPREVWGRVSVLASCETPADVVEARARGYAAAIVKSQERTEVIDGLRYVPCPQQNTGVTCVECRMCLRDSTLAQAGTVITFTPHGTRKSSVTRELNSINLLELAKSR